MKSKKQMKEELHQLIESILEEAIAEADRGETISFEEFKASMDQWRINYKSTNARNKYAEGVCLPGS